MDSTSIDLNIPEIRFSNAAVSFSNAAKIAAMKPKEAEEHRRRIMQLAQGRPYVKPNLPASTEPKDLERYLRDGYSVLKSAASQTMTVADVANSRVGGVAGNLDTGRAALVDAQEELRKNKNPAMADVVAEMLDNLDDLLGMAA